ncbi:MAG: hypothetical protein RIG84_00815 [Roseovarius sp.]
MGFEQNGEDQLQDKPQPVSKLPKKLLEQLGYFAQLCSRIELAACEVIILIEKPSRELLEARRSVLRGKHIKPLIKEFGIAAEKLIETDVYKPYFLELCVWLEENVEDRHRTTHGVIEIRERYHSTFFRRKEKIEETLEFDEDDMLHIIANAEKVLKSLYDFCDRERALER